MSLLSCRATLVTVGTVVFSATCLAQAVPLPGPVKPPPQVENPRGKGHRRQSHRRTMRARMESIADMDVECVRRLLQQNKSQQVDRSLPRAGNGVRGAMPVSACSP
jgi:hypothetical protein